MACKEAKPVQMCMYPCPDSDVAVLAAGGWWLVSKAGEEVEFGKYQRVTW